MSTPKTVGESSKSGASIVQGRVSARSNNRRCDWSAILGQEGGQSFAPEKFVVVGYCRILTEVLGFLTFQAEMELCCFFFFFSLKEKSSCVPVSQGRQSLFTPIEGIRTNTGDSTGVWTNGEGPAKGLSEGDFTPAEGIRTNTADSSQQQLYPHSCGLDGPQ